MSVVEIAIGIKRVNHWIGGEVVESKSGRSGIVWNPATGEAQAHVDFASAAEVDYAVSVAQKAFPAWRATALSRRAEVLFKMRELVDANRSKIATFISLEHGKTLSDAMGEVARGLENIEFAFGYTRRTPHCFHFEFYWQLVKNLLQDLTMRIFAPQHYPRNPLL